MRSSSPSRSANGAPATRSRRSTTRSSAATSTPLSCWGFAPAPVGRFLALGLKHRECGLAQGLEESGQQVLERLRSGLAVLDTLVTLSPMLGILGTVTGIIASFELLGASPAGTDPAAIAGGIAEALITTAAGLVVSMMALIPFNMFRTQIARWARKLEQAGRHCELACAKGRVDAP